MRLREPSDNHRKLIIGGIVVALVGLYLIGFWRELRDVFQMLAQLPGSITPGRLESLRTLLYTLLVFAGFASLWIVFAAGQALLPVSSAREKWRTGYQFLLYIFGRHGPAVFVKDGELLSTKDDHREGPGVAVIDFNSAIVLEERLPPAGLGAGLESGADSVLTALGLADAAQSPRVLGPGLAFTRGRERIRGAVDLRKQFRVRREVKGYSRDGIEVSADVWAVFTLGQSPDVLDVAYDGQPRPENLRVARFDAISDGYFRFTGFSDELDELDRQEIHHQARVIERTHQLNEYALLPPAERSPIFDRERVFQAVFSQARAEGARVSPWTDLPLQLAAELFRGILSQVNYDQLYQIGSEGPLPLAALRDKLHTQMRNNGLLAYRLVRLAAGLPFEARHVYRPADLLVSPPQMLLTPKVLRERGIKVLASGFGDALPVSQAVYAQRLASWKAPWERDQTVTAAASEREAMRIRARGRALAQQDLITHLQTIISTTQNNEVLVVRLLQALELVSADEQTRQFLPADTVDLMKHVRELLGPGDAATSSLNNTPSLPGGQP